MRPLDINLASQPFRNNTLVWIGYGLGFTLALGLLVWNVDTWWVHRQKLGEMSRTLQDLDAKMADLDQRELAASQTLQRDEYDLASLTVQAEGANEVIDWKAFSWTRLFNRVEQALPWNVHVTSIRPLFHDRHRDEGPEDQAERKSIVIAVEGYAKSLEALLDFEARLFSHSSFDYPEPKRHQPTEQGEIVFELDFTYYPDDDGAQVDEPDVADESAEQAAVVETEPQAAPAAASVPGPAPAEPQVAVAVPESSGQAVPNPLAAEPDPAAAVSGTPVPQPEPPAGPLARPPSRPGRQQAQPGARAPATKAAAPPPKKRYANVAAPRQEVPVDPRRGRGPVPPPPYADDPLPEPEQEPIEEAEEQPDENPVEEPPPDEEPPAPGGVRP